MNINPFKFLDSYTKADCDIFFSCEKEPKEIFPAVLWQDDPGLRPVGKRQDKSFALRCGKPFYKTLLETGLYTPVN
jgi:hypothetical protein